MLYKSLFLILVMLIAACSNNNASKAYLYSHIPGSDEYFLVTHKSSIDSLNYSYSGNPIFIAKDSKFTIKIEDVYTGSMKNTANKNSNKSSSKSHENNKKFNNIKNKELWMLTTISSLDPNDPLETNSKRYFKSTNVLLDAESFSFLPLDSQEQYIFTHESDMSYRVTIQLFEVDGFEFKSEVAKISKSPGLWGIAESGIKTVASTLGSVAGDTVVQWIQDKSGEKLALERFLLKAGATQEFYGQFVILRENNFFDKVKESKLPLKDNEIDDIFHIMKNIDGKVSFDQSQIKSVFANYRHPFRSKSYLLYDHFKKNLDC